MRRSETMLDNAQITAIVPVSNIETAIEFYEGAGAGQSRHTVAGFRVDDLDSVVPALREKGVTFEEYDLPDLKTIDGIASVGDVRAAWCRDPDGNILAIESPSS